MPPSTSAPVTAAIALAREALVADMGAAAVGEANGTLPVDDSAVVCLFECTLPGYRGWQWHVTVATVGEDVSLSELALIPTAEAITAPAWLPYRERIRPGDLSPGDLLPVEDDDPRLVPTYSFGEEELTPAERTQVRTVAGELGLGRVRTLSLEGMDQAFSRWMESDAGPDSPLAASAPHPCGSCGFMLRIAGRAGLMFGVCANSDANDDGKVVAHTHGCGAHSEVRLARRHRPIALPEPVLDTITEFEPL